MSATVSRVVIAPKPFPNLWLLHRVIVRIAVITESFPPDVNGVAHCVLRVAEHLVQRGHHPLVIAPRPADCMPRPDGVLPYPVVRMPSLPMPGYPGFRIAAAGSGLRAALTGHGTELVHLASPFMLGGGGAFVAGRLRLPMVAVYQTDMPSYARAYRFGPRASPPPGAACAGSTTPPAGRSRRPPRRPRACTAHGIQRVWLWGRGVDTVRFDPAKRSGQLRAELAPNGEVLAGYVGRLAPEKRIDLLAQVATLPGVRLVVVGSGPADAAARRAMPAAVFLGQRQGEELASIYASLDVFVHSGPHETFGQTLQEAAASGLPVVAPAAGGPIDLVGDGVTGFLVPPRRPGCAGRRRRQAGRRPGAARPPGQGRQAAGARPDLDRPG